uniref:Uncharacterized protein n=1 Tax=Anguilla anguilla TaxID=7936 RepID=A0A0E9WA69_ANGAN
MFRIRTIFGKVFHANLFSLNFFHIIRIRKPTHIATIMWKIAIAN